MKSKAIEVTKHDRSPRQGGTTVSFRSGRKVPLVLAFLVWSTVALSAVPGAAASSSQQVTVTVVHGLPNFTADIYVNGKLLLDGFKPRSEAGPLHVSPGQYHIAIRNVGASPSSKPVLEGSVNLVAGGNYSIVAHLDDKGGAALSAYRNPEAPIPAGQAKVVVRAVATLPPLTMEANDRTVASRVPPGGEQSALIPPGGYEVKVFTKGDTKPVLPAQDIRIHEGSAYILYVVGSDRDHTLGLMVQPFTDLASAPSGVNTGDGGLADPRHPTNVFWAEVLLGTVLILAGARRMRRRPGRSS